jgi:hypothetical protein
MKSQTIALTAFPDSAWATQLCLNEASSPCWPVSGLVETTFVAFPSLNEFNLSGKRDKSGAQGLVHLPLRGQRWLAHTLLNVNTQLPV